MKPVDFDYVAPASLAEAVDLLRQHGPEAKILAGGQSLVPMLNMRLARPGVLIDIGRLPDLAGIADVGEALRIGALTRHRTVEQSPVVATRLPLLAAAVRWIGHTQIRNRGTLGGSLVHADPAAEIPLVALTLDAQFEIQGLRGTRTVPAADFFQGLFTTAVGADEILIGVRFPVWSGQSGWSFQEVARRRGDFALVSAAAQLQVDRAGRISRVALGLGGVAGTPLRLAKVEKFLHGKAPESATLAAAADQTAAAIDPDGDLHASAEYRREVAGVLLRRALSEAARRTEAK